jgi:hypothetical protein
MRRRGSTCLAVVAIVVIAAMAGISAGCAKQAVAPAASTGAAPTGPAPGVTRLPDGGSRVVGTLRHLDLEGGVWVIVAARPGTTDAKATTLAVITNPELFEIDALTGKYVQAVGTIDEKAVSTNMAGPQMQATSITAVTGTGK